jgi:hypothetical protein
MLSLTMVVKPQYAGLNKHRKERAYIVGYVVSQDTTFMEDISPGCTGEGQVKHLLMWML